MTRIATTNRRRTRPGFTIVELLVAAAVCVLIMAILATCFQTGIDAVRQLKSQGDMTDQLRAAEIVIRRDLQAKRFLSEDDKENLGVRLSDLRYDQIYVAPGATTISTLPGYPHSIRPPRGGFFRVKSSDTGAGNVYEGNDPDGMASSRSFDHYLHFTSILPGGTDQNLYKATVANAVAATPDNPRGEAAFNSAAAEIALFLDTGTGATGFAGPVPLYQLIRRQRLVAMNETETFSLVAPSGIPDPGVISSRLVNGRWVVNTLADLTNPNNRLFGPLGGIATNTPVARDTPPWTDGFLAPLGTNRIGDDVLLTNVISFEVKVHWEAAKYGIPAQGFPPRTANFPPWIDPRAYSTSAPAPHNDNDNDGNPDANTDYPFDYLPSREPGNPRGSNNLTSGFNQALNVAGGRSVYDSWTTAFPRWNTSASGPPVVNTTPNPIQNQVPAPDPQAIPMRIRVKAIQIHIRVFDPKLKNARQMTIVQDM